MGVKDLWNIISPSCERKPLFELQGKTIAIDLSGWIVDSQTVTDNVAQPKMYLRNLYFRTANLLMQDISPVFVLEGKAPELKHKAIAKRNEARNGDEARKTSKKGGRSRFNGILKECETMLDLMGIRCVGGSGEAEATCARLNADGLVDGCISQDSDCFLYGARTVYRNFCISAQGNRGSAGSVDEYSMEKIERLFGLGRNKMITLALLCGCDYDDGVNGVGKEAAMKLFKVVDDEHILDRITSWTNDEKFRRMESKLKDPNICTSCGHAGKVKTHAKSGCPDCGTVTKCDESYKETRALVANEISLRKKALATVGFPNRELIEEFLLRRDQTPSRLDLGWKQPKIVEFIRFMERHVNWEPEYAFAKIFPLTTRWQLRNFVMVPAEERLRTSGAMIPVRIKKIRNVRCVASYEIVWNDKDGILEGLTLGKTSDGENEVEAENVEVDELASIEPQDAFRLCYPELSEDFENARMAKKKPKKSGKKRIPLTERNEARSEAATKKKGGLRRPRGKAVAAEVGNRKMDEFVERVASLEESFEAMTIARKRGKPGKPEESSILGEPIASGTPKRGPQFDRVLASENRLRPFAANDTLGRMFDELTASDFPSEMENESINISEIIDGLCGKTTFQVSEARSVTRTNRLDANSMETSRTLDPASENHEDDRDDQDTSDEFDIPYVPLSQRVKLS